MGMIIENPPEPVLDKVRERWSYTPPRNFWRKLTDHIFIRPVAIEIVRTKNVGNNFRFGTGKPPHKCIDARFKHCIGETLQRWWYNDEGLQSIPLNADTSKNVDYCLYSIDEKKKLLAIAWKNMFSGYFRGSKIRRGFHGTVYEINDNNGVEEYKRISTWIV